MDKAKAKKAKSKAKQIKADPEAIVNAALLAQQIKAATLNPEIQAGQIDLQPATTNPYHAMGTMNPNAYSPGNLIGGQGLPMVYNPET
jgi:hypothetical protein